MSLLTSLVPVALQKKWAADKAEEVLAGRREHVAEIARLRAEEIDRLPALQKATDAARKKWKAAEHAATAAEKNFHQADAARQSLGFSTDQQVLRHEAALLQTADPMIDAFLAELSREHDALRSGSAAQTLTRRGEVNRVRDTVAMETFSNAGSRVARLAAIRVAREAARALKLAALPSEELGAEITKLRESLPDGDHLELVHSEARTAPSIA